MSANQTNCYGPPFNLDGLLPLQQSQLRLYKQGWANFDRIQSINSNVSTLHGNNTGLDIEYSTGTLYVACIGDIKKQTNGVGSFISQSNVGAFAFNSIGIDSVGNVFSVAINSSYTAFAIYKQTNYAIGSTNLQGGTLKLNAGTHVYCV